MLTNSVNQVPPTSKSKSFLHHYFNKHSLELSQSFKITQISDDEKRACISAFYLPDYASRLESVPPREPGTCEWVTEHRNVRAWSESQSSELLWLSGNPGCGKTVISSFLIESLRTHSEITTIYFICDNKLEHFRSKENILRFILHQLMTHDPSLVHHAIGYYRNMQASVAKSSSAMWAIFVNMLKGQYPSKPVFFVLDALDECDIETRE